MPPEIFDAIKTIAPPVATGLIGYFAGKPKKKADLKFTQEQIHSLEFERLYKLYNELQEKRAEDKAEYERKRAEDKAEANEKNKILRARIILIEQQHKEEREQDQNKILKLEIRVADLEQENKQLREELNKYKEGNNEQSA